MSATLHGLLSLLAGAPVLPGARCRGRHHLFDPERADEAHDTAMQRHRQAIGLCVTCPALAACREWVNALPPRRQPPGIVAGRLTEYYL